ncbi:hypothetical protein CEXT_59151 [Caerostris extrusa]|uniref:Ycf15 n=1 Tax=Caerostris extrusa TaxID=172846 RepID=A0AAV4U5P4_CAEEX|nr:hypothetical protein CEXT_59151 [Caerostris extrusa]
MKSFQQSVAGTKGIMRTSFTKLQHWDPWQKESNDSVTCPHFEVFLCRSNNPLSPGVQRISIPVYRFILAIPSTSLAKKPNSLIIRK